ncbi:MAG: alpha/beta fold hydrolase [Hyphomonadaceae bacterium]|nr:alpha/beta fold hydrolase [Hyphomonadaceae bacterium]MBC6413067.1 alpha/beta fold hydrolase [Hyphomonadaceae bacterium]
MTPVRRRFVDGPFGQVHVRVRFAKDPDKPPLVCLHQSPKSGREFVNFMKAMDDRTVVAIDNPGHGESDLPLCIRDATIENYAGSAWAVVDALGFGQIDLLGHHTGTKVATEMAWQKPDGVRQIVMVSALVLTPEEQADFEAQFRPVPLDENGTRFKNMWEKSIQHRGPGVSLEDLAVSFAENLRAGEAYEWGHKAAFEYNPCFRDRVAALEHKVTVLNPKDMLHDLTPRVAPLLKNGEVIDHPEWGFGFMDAYADDAVKAVTAALG